MEAQARITAVRGAKVTVAVDPPHRAGLRPPRVVAIAGALPKGRRAAVLVEKLTELGLSTFIPVAWERAQVRTQVARLARVAEAAAKQCGRADVPEIAPETDVDDALAMAERYDQVLWADPEGAPMSTVLKPGSVLAYVGPEGGFTKGEREKLAVVARPVRLAPTVLRVETAALALVAGIWAVE